MLLPCTHGVGGSATTANPPFAHPPIGREDVCGCAHVFLPSRARGKLVCRPIRVQATKKASEGNEFHHMRELVSFVMQGSETSMCREKAWPSLFLLKSGRFDKTLVRPRRERERERERARSRDGLMFLSWTCWLLHSQQQVSLFPGISQSTPHHINSELVQLVLP